MDLMDCQLPALTCVICAPLFGPSSGKESTKNQQQNSQNQKTQKTNCALRALAINHASVSFTNVSMITGRNCIVAVEGGLSYAELLTFPIGG